MQEIVDSGIGVYTVANSILSLLLQHSPFEVQRHVYQKSLLERGGYFPNAFIPPDVMDIIQEGTAVTLLPDDTLAPYKHKVVLSEEVWTKYPIGYFYQRNLPMKREIDEGLQYLLGTGVIQRVGQKNIKIYDSYWYEYSNVSYCR